MKNIALKLALMFAAVSSLVACTGMTPGYETPTVNVQSFRAVPSGSGAGLPAFEIDLLVTNPNLEPLELAGVSYSISLNDQKIINGVGNDLPVIAGYGQGSFTVAAGVNLLAGIRLFRSLTSNADGMFDYAFEAKLDPGSMRRKIRVKDSGSISLGSAARIQ